MYIHVGSIAGCLTSMKKSGNVLQWTVQFKLPSPYCIKILNTLYTFVNTVRYVGHRCFSHWFLACLFWRKSWAIVIARSSSLLLSVSITQVLKGISNLEYLLFVTRCSCKTRDITLGAIFLELCLFLTKNFK